MNDDEKARLAAVYALHLLDTGPEERFDRITRLTRSQFQIPIGIVSLMDVDRQWFKSVCGFDATQTSRELTFCDHTLRLKQLLIVPDATRDERFCSNPFVTSENGIRFYAGYPLISNGQVVGTYCMADTSPRQLTAEQVQAFMDLGAIAQDEIVKLALATAAASTADQLSAEQARVQQLVDEVSKRKLTQALLADNEQRLRRMLETSLDSFVCMDAHVNSD